MFITLRLYQGGQLGSVGTERVMRFFGQDQPVVPVPDLVLQLLERLADSTRFPIVAARFGHVSGLFGPLAEVVKITLIQPLHLVGKTSKLFERDDRRTALASAAADLAHRSLE